MRFQPCIPIFVLAVVTAACGQRGGDEAPTTTDVPGEPSPPVTAAPVPVPVPAGDNLAAPTLVPAAEKGEKGARNVLLEWARALERRDFARADAQWGEAVAKANSAERFAMYRKLTVALGEGAIEGAAGSLYYEAPVLVTGERGGGIVDQLSGTVTARRVNDVPGATPEQLRWHIERSTLRP